MSTQRRRSRVISQMAQTRTIHRPQKKEPRDIFKTHPHLRKGYMSLASRILYASIALALITYSLFSLFAGYVILPGRHQSALAVMGTAMWLQVAAMWACSCHLLACVMGHHRPHPALSIVSKVAGITGWVLFSLGILVAVITPNESVVTDRRNGATL